MSSKLSSEVVPRPSETAGCVAPGVKHHSPLGSSPLSDWIAIHKHCRRETLPVCLRQAGRMPEITPNMMHT